MKFQDLRHFPMRYNCKKAVYEVVDSKTKQVVFEGADFETAQRDAKTRFRAAARGDYEVEEIKDLLRA